MKKLLSMLLVGCMVLSVLPMSAMALSYESAPMAEVAMGEEALAHGEDVPAKPAEARDDQAELSAVGKAVAEINGTQYDTLTAAIAAVPTRNNKAEPTQITLLANTNEAAHLKITNKNIDLNLNDHTITFAADKYLNVTWSKVRLLGEGTVVSSKGSHVYQTVKVTGYTEPSVKTELTVGENVTVINNGAYGVNIFDYYKAGVAEGTAAGVTVTIDGTIQATYGATVYGVVKDTREGYAPVFNLGRTGRITGLDGQPAEVALYGAGYGIYNIAGALEGKYSGVEVRAGELTVEESAKITATKDFSDETPNPSGTTCTGVALAVSQHSTNLPIKVNVKGGAIEAKGEGGRAVYEIDTVDKDGAAKSEGVEIKLTGGSYTGKVESTNEGKLGVTGGTFSSDVSEYVTNNADVTTTEDGVTTVTMPTEPNWDTHSDKAVWLKNTNGYYSETAADVQKALFDAGEYDDAVIVCNPAATFENWTHMHVYNNLTIYGNNASVVSGEHDLEIDTYKYSTTVSGKQDGTNGRFMNGSSLTLEVHELDGVAAWGERHTETEINLKFVDCQNMNRVYFSGTKGTMNIELQGCSFNAANGSNANTSVYTNAPGVVTISGTDFDGIAVPINLNNKSDDVQYIVVTDATFDHCATTENATGATATYAAPIRVACTNEAGSSHLSVDGCTFTDSGDVNGQILLGEGRANKKSYLVTAEIKNTAAEVQIQKPGDRTEEANNSEKLTVTAAAPATLSNAVAEVDGKGYMTLQAALAAANGQTVTLLTDVNLTQAIPVTGPVKIDGGADKHALSSTAPGGRMFEIAKGGNGSIEMNNVTLTIKANGTSGAVPFYNLKADAAPSFTFTNGRIVAAEEENVFMVNLFQGQNVKYTFNNNEVAVPAQGLLVNMADGSEVKDNTIDLKGEELAAKPGARTGVISVNEQNAVTEGITVTGNTFKNANRVLGVDHAKNLTNDKLTFKNNSMIDCRWGFELNPEAQSGFDLSENYYQFGEEEPGLLRVENSESKGSHFAFGETGTEYVPAAGTTPAVTVNSYYTDARRNEESLVTFAAQLISGGATTAYLSVAAAIVASQPGDTVKVLDLSEAMGDNEVVSIAIPNDKAVQLVCGEALADEFRNHNMDPAAYLPAYFTYQARVTTNGGTQNTKQLYGGAEVGLTVEKTLYTGGTRRVDLMKDWTLGADVTLPTYSSTTSYVYVLDNATIDLNGHTLAQQPSAQGDPATQDCTTAGWDGAAAIIVYTDKTVTVKDSSAGKTGKVIGSAQTFDVCAGGTLNLESGTFTTLGNWYNASNYRNGFGSIVRMDGGTLNISGGKLAIPTTNAAGSVKMAATIMLRGDGTKNPTRAYTINITGGEIETVPESNRASESFKEIYRQNDGLVAINLPVINDPINPNGKNITYAITGGTFDMDLRSKTDGAGKAYLGEGYASPEDTANPGSFVVGSCTHTATNVTEENVVPATCTADGSYVEVTTCTVCGHVTRANKTIPMLGHDLRKWVHSDESHWHTCTRCDASVFDIPVDHSWVLGTVTGGRRTDTCECGATRTVSVSTDNSGSNRPATRPDPVEPQPQPPEEDLNEPDVPLTDKPFLFTDVTANDWYYDAVKYVSAANMMLGVNAEGTRFAPALNTTRASVAQILFRLEKEPTASAADFADVVSGAWYTDAVNWSDAAGLMVGFGDRTFRPDTNITREQLVTVLYRYAKRQDMDVTAAGDLSAFVDAEEVGDWAQEAMAWAVDAGIVKGRSGALLAPGSLVSRSELATILQRFQALAAKEG